MYRYSLQKFNSSLLNMGEIRIGTLHDFRRTEHTQGIADPKEGKKKISHNIEYLHISDTANPNWKDNDNFTAFKRFGINLMPGPNANIKFHNATLVKNLDGDDCFILCTSKSRSRQTMSQFEGADSCIEIINVQLFYSVLTETLNAHSPVIFKGIHEVKYQNREEQWNGQDWGNHPSIIKETDFKNQYELRAIWEPRSNQPIAPVILGNCRLRSYCRNVLL